MKIASLAFYLWSAVAADEVHVIAGKDGDGGSLKADRALQLLLPRLNLHVDELQQLQVRLLMGITC